MRAQPRTTFRSFTCIACAAFNMQCPFSRAQLQMLTVLQDISLYGEAPVREILSGPDRERYVNDNSQGPPKTSSSSRSGHSHSHVHLPGHNHRHNKSNDDTRSLRPTISRQDSGVSTRQKAPTSMGTALGNSSVSSLIPRSKSPTPSSSTNRSQTTGRHAANEDPTSPTHQSRRGILGRFRKHKEKDGTPPRLKEIPGSVRSLNTPASKSGQASPDFGHWSGEGSITGSDVALPRELDNGQFGRPGYQRQGTFNKLPFRKGRGPRGIIDDSDLLIDPKEKGDVVRGKGSVYDLDTNLSNMDGILSKPPL